MNPESTVSEGREGDVENTQNGEEAEGGMDENGRREEDLLSTFSLGAENVVTEERLLPVTQRLMLAA